MQQKLKFKTLKYAGNLYRIIQFIMIDEGNNNCPRFFIHFYYEIFLIMKYFLYICIIKV